MPTEDMNRFIAYYSEMIDDRMEDGMTEEEAHRYLQKSSMANGVNMIETAQMVLSILGKNV